MVEVAPLVLLVLLQVRRLDQHSLAVGLRSLAGSGPPLLRSLAVLKRRPVQLLVVVAEQLAARSVAPE